MKQVRSGRMFQREVADDSDTVALLPPTHTGKGANIKGKIPGKGKLKKRQSMQRKTPSSTDNSVEAESFAGGHADSDRAPLLPGSRALEKKKRQAEARKLRRQRRKVCN